MLLYESLLAPRGPALLPGSGLLLPDDLTTLLGGAVLVRVDNVNLYYSESAQDYWVINRDFPCLASPWDRSFWEWRVTGRLNHNGVIEETGMGGTRCGVLIEQTPLDVMETSDGGVEALTAAITYAAACRDPVIRPLVAPRGLRWTWAVRHSAERAAAMAETRRTLAKLRAGGARWCAWATVFVEPRQAPAIAAAVQFVYWLDEQGQVCHSPHGEGVALALCPAAMPDDHCRQMVENHAEPLHVPALAMSFAHCRNVAIRDNVAPPKLSRAQARRHGVPKVTFKTLEIQPMAALTRAEERRAGTGSGQALHIMRGHFKDYREGAGLFGRYQGRWWWPMRVRGEPTAGAVVKDYAIQAPVEGR